MMGGGKNRRYQGRYQGRYQDFMLVGECWERGRRIQGGLGEHCASWDPRMDDPSEGHDGVEDGKSIRKCQT